jgi:ABC-2 type transport system permease protein
VNVWVPSFRGIAVAMVKGFVRDRSALFFSMVFPLMFLVLFGTLFDSAASSRMELLQVGDVAVLDDLDEGARGAFEESFDVTRMEDREAALEEVRKGDADVAVEMDGDTLVAHYTETDQVRAAMVQGTVSAFVGSANLAATGQPPRYDFRAESVEDDSLDVIQYFTPGLLGWAVAMSAAIGAAATLQGWRQSRLMHRIQLSPAPASAVISARIVVTVLIALVQMAIFLLVATAGFGLRLTDSWYLSVPLLVAGTLSFMALGLFAGAISKTAEGAVNTANFLVLPMAFLSGSFFVLEGAPQWLQAVSWVLPLRHLNEGMLDVLARGEGLTAMLPQMGYVLGFGLVVGAAAVLIFRRSRG